MATNRERAKQIVKQYMNNKVFIDVNLSHLQDEPAWLKSYTKFRTERFPKLIQHSIVDNLPPAKRAKGATPEPKQQSDDEEQSSKRFKAEKLYEISQSRYNILRLAPPIIGKVTTEPHLLSKAIKMANLVFVMYLVEKHFEVGSGIISDDAIKLAIDRNDVVITDYLLSKYTPQNGYDFFGNYPESMTRLLVDEYKLFARFQSIIETIWNPYTKFEPPDTSLNCDTSAVYLAGVCAPSQQTLSEEKFVDLVGKTDRAFNTAYRLPDYFKLIRESVYNIAVNRINTMYTEYADIIPMTHEIKQLMEKLSSLSGLDEQGSEIALSDYPCWACGRSVDNYLDAIANKILDNDIKPLMQTYEDANLYYKIDDITLEQCNRAHLSLIPFRSPMGRTTRRNISWPDLTNLFDTDAWDQRIERIKEIPAMKIKSRYTRQYTEMANDILEGDSGIDAFEWAVERGDVHLASLVVNLCNCEIKQDHIDLATHAHMIDFLQQAYNSDGTWYKKDKIGQPRVPVPYTSPVLKPQTVAHYETIAKKRLTKAITQMQKKFQNGDLFYCKSMALELLAERRARMIFERVELNTDEETDYWRGSCGEMSPDIEFTPEIGKFRAYNQTSPCNVNWFECKTSSERWWQNIMTGEKRETSQRDNIEDCAISNLPDMRKTDLTSNVFIILGTRMPYGIHHSGNTIEVKTNTDLDNINPQQNDLFLCANIDLYNKTTLCLFKLFNEENKPPLQSMDRDAKAQERHHASNLHRFGDFNVPAAVYEAFGQTPPRSTKAQTQRGAGKLSRVNAAGQTPPPQSTDRDEDTPPWLRAGKSYRVKAVRRTYNAEPTMPGPESSQSSVVIMRAHDVCVRVSCLLTPCV